MGILGWILVGVVVVLVLWVIVGYNSLVRRKAMVEEAFSGMDVYLKKRYDLIPNLVNTVKGYATHEKETLDSVVAARSAALGGASSGDINARVSAESKLDSALGRLLVVAEQYPNLKSDQSFLDLQAQLKAIELDVAQSRKYYNGAARQYNEATRTFPSVVLASIFGFRAVSYFEVSSEAEREAPVVDFSK